MYSEERDEVGLGRAGGSPLAGCDRAFGGMLSRVPGTVRALAFGSRVAPAAARREP